MNLLSHDQISFPFGLDRIHFSVGTYLKTFEYFRGKDTTVFVVSGIALSIIGIAATAKGGCCMLGSPVEYHGLHHWLLRMKPFVLPPTYLSSES
jgi:hypothetical protein